MQAIQKRDVFKCIVLSCVTCGIYFIYWLYTIVKNVKQLRHDQSGCGREMFCLLFIPPYIPYWWYTRGKWITKAMDAQGVEATGNDIAYLILSIFGLEIVALAIMQNDFNALSNNPPKEIPNAPKEVAAAPYKAPQGAAVSADTPVFYLRCPSCGTEQSSKNDCCANCGHRFTRSDEQSPAAKQQASSAASVIPIASTEEHVVCPRCGTRQRANRSRCLNCGVTFKE